MQKNPPSIQKRGGIFWGETAKTEGESSQKSYFQAFLPCGTETAFPSLLLRLPLPKKAPFVAAAGLAADAKSSPKKRGSNIAR